ncbi:MAG: glycosyl hydrolase family 8 [Verrucomicrobiota bacterium]
MSGREHWEEFKERFITGDGRVIDDVNGGISHSEGQGYALVLATHFDDEATFRKVWKWTRDNLQVRNGDRLFAWKWEETQSGAGEVADINNASDGDVLIAWGLSRGYEHWGRRDYRHEALAICKSIRASLIRDSKFGPLLVPGAQGFDHHGKTVVNLSYWIYPAFEHLSNLDKDTAIWKKLFRSGIELTTRARFSRDELPPDWIEVSRTVRPATGFEPSFGYNAIRIPLYLAWLTEREGLDELLVPFANLASKHEGKALPARIAVQGFAIDSEPAVPGMVDTLEFARRASNDLKGMPDRPFEASKGYYSSVLQLLVNCAARENQTAPGKPFLGSLAGVATTESKT